MAIIAKDMVGRRLRYSDLIGQRAGLGGAGVSGPNWSNQTIWTGDNLDIMRGMNSESVDLIYLDPPFNSKANYAAPIGSKAAGAAFKDTWTLSDVDAEWINLIEAKHPALYRVLLAAMTDSDKSYLAYMAARARNAPTAQAHGQHLPTLRSDDEPLPEAACWMRFSGGAIF